MTFLHIANCPKSIDVLLALRAGRDWSPIGLTPEPNGLDVDFDALLGSYLSSTEKATVRLVQAVHTVEGKGGLPQRASGPLVELLADLSGYPDGGRTVTEGTDTAGGWCSFCDCWTSDHTTAKHLADAVPDPLT